MTQTDAPTVDNGVNIEALRGARQALTDAPEAAQFQWRARCEWVRGTHSRSTITDFSGLGQEHAHRQAFTIDADHPEVFASEDNGATPPEIVLAALASCLTAGVATVATNRGVQLRSVTATVEGGMDLQGILGIDGDVRNGFDGDQGHLRHRRRRARAPTSRRSSPSRRSARRCSTSSRTRRPSASSSPEPAVTLGRGADRDADTRRHRRRRSGRAGDEPPPHRRPASTTSCSNAARWRTRGGTSGGTRSACSRRTG